MILTGKNFGSGFRNAWCFMTYTTQAIVLKKIPAGEADAIVILYTRDFGKVRARAQGVFKEHAKLKGHVEPISLASVQFLLGTYGQRLIYSLMLEHFAETKRNFDAYSASRYMVELVDHHCLLEQKDERMWELLLSNLLLVEKSSIPSLPEIVSSFEQEFLHSLGYGTSSDMRSLGIPLARPYRVV